MDLRRQDACLDGGAVEEEWKERWGSCFGDDPPQSVQLAANTTLHSCDELLVQPG
jgi:hypothetical protein